MRAHLSFYVLLSMLNVICMIEKHYGMILVYKGWALNLVYLWGILMSSGMILKDGVEDEDQELQWLISINGFIKRV